MRFGFIVLALGVVLAGPAAQANTISFGSWNGAATTCSAAGNAADRSCTHGGTVNNGALDTTASAALTAEASADHGITTNPTAIADMTVSYTIPYTVTRTVNVIPGALAQLVIPSQQITLNLNFSGEVAKDNSQATGGLGQALLDTLSVTVSSARFGNALMGADISQTGGGGLARSPFNRATPDIAGVAGRNFDGAAGEISLFAQIPTNYRDWEDFVVPYALDYDLPHSFTQSFTDTLTVTFRLRAESRPSGSVSTTGGEALACAGRVSPLGGFDLDNSAACGSGLTIAASVTQTGTTSEAVPEPTTLLMFGLGIAGLASVGSRLRSR